MYCYFQSIGLGLLPPTPPVNFSFEGVDAREDPITKNLANYEQQGTCNL